MKGATRIEVTAPVAARAEYLCKAYSDLVTDFDLLTERLTRLVRLQGHARVKDWIKLAEDGAHLALAEDLIRHHYDPRYAKVRDRRHNDTVRMDTESLDDTALDALAAQIAQMVSGA